MTEPYSPTPDADELQDEIRKLVFMWASCCISPIIYLGIAWFIIYRVKDGTGYFPFSADTHTQILIALVAVLIVLQGFHLVLKRRYSPLLIAALQQSTGTFLKALTRRTFILIFISEMVVFIGFLMAIIQGDLAVLFGSGLAAMFLYAQSHPRSALPPGL